MLPKKNSFVSQSKYSHGRQTQTKKQQQEKKKGKEGDKEKELSAYRRSLR